MAGSFETSLESHRHLLGDVDAQRVALDKSVALAEVMGTIKVPDIALHLGGAVSLAQFQTGFRDQEGRGTCYAFAACAALEAAYKRKHELELGGGRAPYGRVRRSEGNGRGGYRECTCHHNSQTRRPGLGAGEQQAQEDPR